MQDLELQVKAKQESCQNLQHDLDEQAAATAETKHQLEMKRLKKRRWKQTAQQTQEDVANATTVHAAMQDSLLADLQSMSQKVATVEKQLNLSSSIDKVGQGLQAITDVRTNMQRRISELEDAVRQHLLTMLWASEERHQDALDTISNLQHTLQNVQTTCAQGELQQQQLTSECQTSGARIQHLTQEVHKLKVETAHQRKALDQLAAEVTTARLEQKHAIKDVHTARQEVKALQADKTVSTLC